MCHIHTFCVLHCLKSGGMRARCLQGSSNSGEVWVRGIEMVCPPSTLF